MNNLVVDQISFSYSEEKILDNITFSLNNDDFLLTTPTVEVIIFT